MSNKKDVYSFFVNFGIRKCVSGEYEEAKNLLNIGLEALNNPNMLDDETIKKGLFSRGVSFLRLKNYELAENDFSDILEFNPNYLPALYGKAISLFKLKQYKNAIAPFEQFLDLSSDIITKTKLSAYFKLMICYDNTQNYLNAKRTAEIIIQINPNLIEPLKCLSKYYYNEKQWTELKNVVETLICHISNSKNNDPTITLYKCIIAQKIGNKEDLERYYVEYIKNFSSETQDSFEGWEKLGIIYNNYGCLLAHKENWADASEKFMQAYENYEFNLECEKNRCISALKLNKYQQALEFTQELVDGNGRDDAESWYLRGLVQIKLNNIPEACESFKNASNQVNSSQYIQESYWQLLQLYQYKLQNIDLENNQKEDDVNLFSDLFDKFEIPNISMLEIEL